MIYLVSFYDSFWRTNNYTINLQMVCGTVKVNFTDIFSLNNAMMLKILQKIHKNMTLL